ncbi:hypothetical protein ACROYT_G026819 [Oculina patagonica]
MENVVRVRKGTRKRKQRAKLSDIEALDSDEYDSSPKQHGSDVENSKTSKRKRRRPRLTGLSKQRQAANARERMELSALMLQRLLNTLGPFRQSSASRVCTFCLSLLKAVSKEEGPNNRLHVQGK